METLKLNAWEREQVNCWWRKEIEKCRVRLMKSFQMEK